MELYRNGELDLILLAKLDKSILQLKISLNNE